MIYFVVPRNQEFGIADYMESWGRNLVGLLSLLHYEDLAERTSFPSGTYVFTALDQLTVGGRRLVGELQRQLKASPSVGAVINDLADVLLRYELLGELYEQGLNRHRAVRATENLSGLRFPVFLHEEFRHGGSLSPLLFTSAELDRALGRAVLQGFSLKELLVVEFCDTADAEGRYRKYAAYVVGPEVIARTMGRGREWMLKADGVEFSEEMLLEERAYVLENPFEDQLRRIFALAGIGYGRIDFAVQDGVVRTWEINTNPTVGPSRKKLMPDEFGPMRQPIRDHFSRRFHAALGALDTQASGEPIPVTFSAECLRGAFPIVFPPRVEGGMVRMALGFTPVKSLANAVVWVLSPLLVWAGKRIP